MQTCEADVFGELCTSLVQIKDKIYKLLEFASVVKAINKRKTCFEQIECAITIQCVNAKWIKFIISVTVQIYEKS